MRGKGTAKNWRLFDNDEDLGLFSVHEIAEMTGMRKNNVSTYAQTGQLYKGRYRIEKRKDIWQEWEESTMRLRKSG